MNLGQEITELGLKEKIIPLPLSEEIQTRDAVVDFVSNPTYA